MKSISPLIVFITLFITLLLSNCKSESKAIKSPGDSEPPKFNETSNTRINLDLKKITLEDCLRVATSLSYEVSEAQQEIEVYKSYYKEAEGMGMPKLNVLTFLAPMPSIKGDALRSKTDLWGNDWAFYYNFDAMLVVPLYTFDRLSEAKSAATDAIEAAKAEKRSITHNVIYNMKKFYYGHLFATTVYNDIIVKVEESLTEALKIAKDSYNKGDGTVKKSDLAKLEIGMIELKKNKNYVESMIKLTSKALTTYLHVGDKEIKLDKEILAVENATIKKVDQYLVDLMKNNPDYARLLAGMKAKKHLVEVEEGANYPVIFAGGILKFAFAPSVDSQPSMFANDPYNTFTGNVGVGAMWTLDLFVTNAKAKRAIAEYKKLVEKKKYADEGFPILLDKTYLALIECQDNIALQKEASRKALGWMTFAFAAFKTGTGEAKDALEGLAAFAQYFKNYYEAIFNYNMALAELTRLIGAEVTDLKY